MRAHECLGTHELRHQSRERPRECTITTGHVFIAMSLDGFIARADGSLDWLAEFNRADEDYGYDEFINAMDGIIMGRKTFEVISGFDQWPYTKPVIVLSTSLQADELPGDIASEVVIARSVPEARTEAARQGWKRAYIDGGAAIRSFLTEGAMCELVVSQVPILLGEGIPLFAGLNAETRLQHLGTRTFSSGLVQSRYEVSPSHAVG